MFNSFIKQKKIELFARNNYFGWDNWGLEIPESKIEIKSLSDKNMDNPILEFDLSVAVSNQ